MKFASDMLTLTESEAYRLRTVLNYALKGQDMSINGIEGRRVGDVVKVEIKGE